MQLVCKKCHKICEEVLRLRIGVAGGTLGSVKAKEQGRELGYYDGLIDGIKEAIGCLHQETGLYWGEIRKEE